MSSGILSRYLATQGRYHEAILSYQGYNEDTHERLVWVWVEMATIFLKLDEEQQALFCINQAISKQNQADAVPLLCQEDIVQMYCLKRNLLVQRRTNEESKVQAMVRYQDAIDITRIILELSFVKEYETEMLSHLQHLLDEPSQIES